MGPIHLGISGTQEGMTEKQAIACIYLFSQLQDDVDFYHHGDCIGVDAEFHALVEKMTNYEYGIQPGDNIIIHPPDNDSKRAFKKSKHIRSKKPYLDRNRDIVSESDIMFIVPKEKTEQFRGSGTWATFRYAKKAGKPVFLIYPDGKFKKILNK